MLSRQMEQNVLNSGEIQGVQLRVSVGAFKYASEEICNPALQTPYPKNAKNSRREQNT